MGIYRTTEEWCAIIEEQQRSGLNQTQYCRLHAITRSAFFNARQRLHPSGETQTAFIPALPPTDVTAPTPDGARIDKPITPALTTVKAHLSTPVTLELPHCTLRLESDISPCWLATLIREMAP